MEKKCTDCKKMLPLEFFYKRPNYSGTTKGYLNSICKKCMIVRSVLWRLKNYERYKKYQREYQKKHYKNRK